MLCGAPSPASNPMWCCRLSRRRMYSPFWRARGCRPGLWYPSASTPSATASSDCGSCYAPSCIIAPTQSWCRPKLRLAGSANGLASARPSASSPTQSFRPVSYVAGRSTGAEAVPVGRGALVPQKGFDVLIRAFALAAPECMPLRLAIAGDGPAAQALRDLVAELRLENRVLFLGNVRELQTLMRRLKASYSLRVTRVFPTYSWRRSRLGCRSSRRIARTVRGRSCAMVILGSWCLARTRQRSLVLCVAWLPTRFCVAGWQRAHQVRLNATRSRTW